MTIQNFWPQEHVDALGPLILSGLSFREAAEALNGLFGTRYSRNALIGKAKRIGLTGPAKPPPKRPRREKRDPSLPRYARQAPKAPPPRAVIEMRCDAIEPRHLSLLDLEPGDCRYPFGEPANGEQITFCGHPILCGSYCSAHYQLSIGPGTASERAAA